MPVIYSKGPTAQQLYEEIAAENNMREVVASILRGVFEEEVNFALVSDGNISVPNAQRPTTRRLSNEAPMCVFDDPLADYGVLAPSIDLVRRSRYPTSTFSNLRGMARLRAIAPPAIVTDVLDVESFMELACISVDPAPITTSGVEPQVIASTVVQELQEVGAIGAQAMVGVALPATPPGAAIVEAQKSGRSPPD
ncbi:unnamed protein product [Cyclocybe aegerita]|uniref:Uncharacterized protein n=1 Tax=Cyclocybe aegerita TaxID=1973307 RepID=A0A8S0WU23_CYCAE|nr:unnamed protein product [Cyclocybe aegerita]